MLLPWVVGSCEHLGLGERENIISSRTAMGSGSQLSPKLAFLKALPLALPIQLVLRLLGPVWFGI